MNFQNEKKQFLSKPDKSLAGERDKAILPLIKKINSLKDFYTTSSCAGRIILIKEKGRKQKAAFLFKSHEPVNFKEINKELHNIIAKEPIYLKHEPAILHVSGSSIAKAQEFIDAARACGWEKSGIIASKNKIIMEIVSVEHLAAPVAVNRKIIINEDYLKILVSEANKKLALTRKKIKNLEVYLKRWKK